MNITEKTLRCPTVAATTPRDQARLTRSTASIKIGSKVRRITTKSRPTVTTSASSVAIVLSWNALSISSFDRAGVPVAPAATSGYVSRRLRIGATHAQAGAHRDDRTQRPDFPHAP